MKLLSVVLVAFFVLLALVNGEITGATPISTQASMLRNVQCLAVPGPLFQSSSPPYPTDSWWVGAGVLPQTSQLAGPYPYIATAENQGLTFGLPNGRYFDGTSIHSPAQNDFSVYASEFPDDINAHKVTNWDELSVTIEWFSGAASMTSYLVQGSAYMTFSFTAATVDVIAKNGRITSFGNQTISTTGATSFSGSKFKVVLSGGLTYILYTLSPISLSVTSAGFTSTAAWTGVLRLATLNGTDLAAAEAALDQSSSTYATGASISYEVTGNEALVNFNWNVAAGGTSANLLQLAWIHHRDVLQNPTLQSAVQFLTVKGYQKGVLGSTWTMKYELSTISWYAPRSPDSSCIQILNTQLDAELQSMTPPVPNDFYFWGGSFGRLARLAVIAEELGRTDLIPRIVEALKESFAPWVNGTATDPAGYETGWGGVVSQLGTNNSGIDYGNGYYNDHHFHYGYHLYGASVIGKYDSAWFAQNKRYITELARDIGNPSKDDPYFPVSRHKDWFAGHSWASGIANGAGGRDEESTTEAINGYYGLYMYSLVAEDCELQNFARILLATEIQSVQHYWHLYPSATTETAYPEQVFRNFATVGNVEDQQAGPWLFWGAQKSEIASIQLLPYTPITEEVIDEDWGRAMYTYVSTEFTDPTVGIDWKNLIYMAHATWDPAAAFAEAQTVTTWGSGNSYTNTLWWIATRGSGSSGSVCSGALVTGVDVYSGVLYSKSAGKYVVVGSGTNAFATATTVTAGTVFNFNTITGGFSMQSNTTLQYASADTSGTAAMVVNRASPSGWETFIFTKVSGDYYAIRASSNSLFLSVNGASGVISNNLTAVITSVPDSGLFKIVCPGGAATCAGPTPITYTYTPGSTVNYPPLSASCSATSGTSGQVQSSTSTHAASSSTSAHTSSSTTAATPSSTASASTNTPTNAPSSTTDDQIDSSATFVAAQVALVLIALLAL